MKAAIYARVSTEEQGTNYSLPTQVEACRAYAQEHGHEVIAEITDTFTGTRTDRPGIDELFDLAEEHTIELIVVHDLDRMARGLTKQAVLEEGFARYGVKLAYVLTPIEDSPEGRFIKGNKSLLAELEREKLMERSQRGLRARAKAGRIIPGFRGRLGYTYTPGPASKVTINEEEAAIVRLIFDLCINEKLGGVLIVKRLNELGIAPRGRRWSKESIIALLKDEAYCGVAYYNKTHSVEARDLKSGHRNIARDRAEWIPIPTPQIVSRETWEAAQRQLARNYKLSARNTTNKYLFRRRVICGVCGEPMTCRTMRVKDKKSGKNYVYPRYGCNIARVISTGCKCRVDTTWLDDEAWKLIVEAVGNPRRLLKQLTKPEQDKSIKRARSRLEIVEGQLAAAEQKYNRKTELYEEGFIEKDRFLADAKPLQATIEELRQTRDELKSRANRPISAELIAAFESVLKKRHYPPKDSKDGDPTQKLVELLRSVVDGKPLTFEEKRSLIDRLDIHVVYTMATGEIRLEGEIKLPFSPDEGGNPLLPAQIA